MPLRKSLISCSTLILVLPRVDMAVFNISMVSFSTTTASEKSVTTAAYRQEEEEERRRKEKEKGGRGEGKRDSTTCGGVRQQHMWGCESATHVGSLCSKSVQSANYA